MGRKQAVWILSLLIAVMLFPPAAQPQAKKTPSKTTKKNGPPPSPPQVRMSWQDFISGPDGAKRLASLQAAITKMKSLDSAPKTSADYRRSWEYWANIHGYYGTQSPDGTVAQQIKFLKDNQMQQYVSYYNDIKDQTPPDATAKKVWATCQHSNPPQQALNFFGWHRMYLYYFERVLRWAANDNTLRLPYWDYTDPSQLELPTNFQSASAPLYDAKRNPDINNGSATLDSASTDVNTLLPNPSYFDYESAIEEGIHGYVHCTVGPTCPVAHMGDVPVAGNDPVFYHHHANIDRLWACWQHLHPMPAGTWQNQQFSFVDETGALVTKPVKGFINTTALGYKYENDSNCARPGVALLATHVVGPVVVAPGIPVENKQVLGTAKGVSVKDAVTSVDIAVPKPAMQTAMAHLENAQDIQLVLRDVTADSHPGVLFNVYLARKDDPSKRERVGTINWFGAFRSHGGQRMKPKKTLRYDVTSELKALGGTDLSDKGVTVVIEATSGVVPKESAKATEQPKLAAQAFRKEANVRIGSIELRAAGAPAPAPKPAPKKK